MTTRLFLWPVAVIAGLLPVRRWAAFDAVLPVREAASLAGLVTMLVGLALGVRGYLAYIRASVERLGSAGDTACLAAAETAGDAGLPLGAWVIPAFHQVHLHTRWRRGDLPLPHGAGARGLGVCRRPAR